MTDKELQKIEWHLHQTMRGLQGGKPRPWMRDQQALLNEVRALRAQLDAKVDEVDELRAGRGAFPEVTP